MFSNVTCFSLLNSKINYIYSLYVLLVSWSCCYKLAQTDGLKPEKLIPSHFRGQKCQGKVPSSRGARKIFPQLPPGSRGCWHSSTCGHITPVSAPVVTWLSRLLCISNLTLSLIRALVPGFRTHSENPGQSLQYPYRIAFTEALFPQASCTGSRVRAWT